MLAVTFIDPNPSLNNQFGHSVVPLATGNVVITAPFDDAGGFNAGAVYLFNGSTGELISTIRGTHDFDQIGMGGVTALANGNFVISSPYWRTVVNNVTNVVGAVTWGDGTTGISGVVSESNSLVGTTSGDGVGAVGTVLALPSGDYVVRTPGWANGAVSNAGAVTWGNGDTGITGQITPSNSLVGNLDNDHVGSNGVTVLENGNYVVISSSWHGGTGAVTWADGTTGITGVVSSENSLVGASTGNEIGSRGILELTNGNFVVFSPGFDNGSVSNTGAVTWVNGATGLTGVVSAANSLIGTGTEDQVGQNFGVALTNGNYVISAPNADVGGISDAGAAIWGDGTTGVKGTISSSNALVGVRSGDRVSLKGIVALTNGNYVVVSPAVDNGNVGDAGAVTWGNGQTGTTGQVTIANSLVGGTINDNVGSGGVTALANGNYVVASPLWNSNLADVGAVTWGDGTMGTTGLVSSSNSMVGSQTSDQVGSGGVIALTNGNYVFGSPSWKNGADATGAITWRNGSASSSGPVNPSNSLVGSSKQDLVGDIGNFKALPNGHYVVLSPNWDNGNVENVGAVTWGNGNTGVTGPISPSNSLIGGTAGDRIGSNGLTILSNSNYVVVSTNFDNGSIVNAGAVTWANGSAPITGTVSAANSLVGSSPADQLGLNGVVALANGNYIVSSAQYDSGDLANVGAVTWANGTTGIVGSINAPSVNHIKGLTANTDLQPITVDNVNGNFYARFRAEFAGVVRVGSQTEGFDVPIAATLTAAFSGGNLTITDIDAAGRNNTLTISRVNVEGIDYFQFADLNEAFASAPVTTPASTLSNGNRTLRIPASAITGTLTLNLNGGNDSLILDLVSGDVIPAGGLQYHGGEPTTGTGDRLLISGGNQGDVTYNYSSSSTGSIAVANFGTITYTGVDQSISNTGAVANMLVNLPTAGPNETTLEDDTISGNGVSRLSGATLVTTDFINPTNALTIVRGNSADNFTFAAAPDLTTALVVGTFPEPFGNVTFTGPLTLGSNKSLTVYSSATISLSTAASDIKTTGTGAITLSTSRNITLASGSSIATEAGKITLDANQQAAATGGDFVGISLDDANLISTNGDIVVRGRGGNNSSGNQIGVRVMAGSEIGQGTSGTVTVLGTGGASTGANNFGVLATGGGAAITSGGGNVVVTGIGGGTGASGNNVGVVVEASGVITAGGNGSVDVTGSGSNATGANRGVLVTGNGSRITSSGGHVSVTGTATGASPQSAGVQVAAAGTITAGLSGSVTVQGTNNNSASSSHGVQVTGSGSSITSSGGAVSVTGMAGGVSTAVQNFGVAVDSAGVISSGGTGSVTVTGTSRNTSGNGGQNIGVMVTGLNSRITSAGGNISVIGTGGGGTSSSNNHGVNVTNNGRIAATDAGTLNIIATGGGGSGGSNHGLFVTGSGAQVAAADGGINVTSAAGAGASLATNFTQNASLSTTSTGNANIAGDSFAIDSTAFFNLGTNSVILRPKTTGGAVNVGGADSVVALGLADAELDRITAGVVQVGDATTGTVTVSSAITSPNNLSLVSGANISVQNTITPAVNKNFSATAGTSVAFPNANSDVVVTGTGTVTITSQRNIQLSSGASISTVNGNVTLSANQQTTPDTSNFKGIEITSATVVSSGTGNVILMGRGGAAPLSSENHGVSITGVGALITSGGGNVHISGQGGGAGNSNNNYGVFVSQGAEVRAGGAGTVTIEGYGASDQTSSGFNVGVRIQGTNARITSGGGDVNVIGHGGLNSLGNFFHGVHVVQGATITSGGVGSVNVTGFGGGNLAGGSTQNYGVMIDGVSQITSNGGNVNVVGTGGHGDGSAGVAVHVGQITAGGAGTVNVQGTGGSGTGGAYSGILVRDGGTITSNAGNITLTGVGGTPPEVGFNYGVVVYNGGIVQPGGNGSVTVNGTGGRDGLQAGTSQGVAVQGAGSRISAGNGNVTIVASGAAGTVSPMLISNEGTVSITGSGSVSIASNGLTIETGGTIDAGSSAVTLKPKTAGVPIDLGADDAAGVLAISDAEFDSITAGTIHFGDETSGPVNVTAHMTRHTPASVTLNSSAAISFTTGTLDTAGGDVTLNPGTYVSPFGSGVEITTGDGTVGFAEDANLRLVMAGLVPDEQYQLLNIVGEVDLTGANLVLVGNLVFNGGERFTVINNDGDDPVIGTFNGLPEGATVSTDFLGSGFSATISYEGGTGNDVVITVGQPPGTTSVAVIDGNLIITDINGGTTDDRITIGLNGTNIRITDPAQILEGGNGAIFISHNTVEVPLALVTGNIQVETLEGDDWLIVDFVTGNPLPPGGLVFNAGSGSADQLILQSGATASIVHTIADDTSGTIILSGESDGTITYTNVEPIIDTVVAADRTYVLGPGSETITLTDAEGFANTLTSTLGWNVTFTNPVDSFTLDAGAGDDIIIIESVDEDGPFNPSITINGGTGNDEVYLNADITLGPDKSLDIDLQNDDIVPGFDRIVIGQGVTLRMSGTGGAVLKASRNIELAPGSTVQTVDGDILVEANRQTTPASGSFVGVSLDGSTLQATGEGSVTVRGRGGDAEDDFQVGVLVSNGGAIIGGNEEGTTIVHGIGGAGTGNFNFGVQLVGLNSQISSNGGNVQVTGLGGGAGDETTGNHGIDIFVDSLGLAAISAGGTGTVAVTGTGSNTQSSAGIHVSGMGATITSSGGAVTVSGQGGNGSSNFDIGVWVDDGGTITSGPGASLTVLGKGGNSPGGDNHGVLVQSSEVVGSRITTGGGSLSITGTGGNGAAGNNIGVFVDAGGHIALPDIAIPLSTFTITGVGGQGATGGGNLGVLLGGDLTSTGPSISIDAIGGNGPDSLGMFIGDSVISLAGTGVLRIKADATVPNQLDLQIGSATTETTISHTGNGAAAIEFQADSVQLDSTVTITATEAAVRFLPVTANRLINLGSTADTTPNTLELSDAELDRITAARLQIGNSTSGNLTISAPITLAPATNLLIESGGAIDFAGGSLTTGGGDVTLNAGTTITPGTAGVDVNMGVTGTLSFGTGNELVFHLTGPEVDTQYPQLNVVGHVNLTGVVLVITGTEPAITDFFVLVKNDDTDEVIGTFDDYEDGAVININGVNRRITYLGDTGNDVVILPGNSPPTIDEIQDVTILEDADLQTITLTGITAGVEAQAISVTATSGSPDIIPHPTVNYTSPNGTATLSFKPLADQFGSVTITVTVRDAGHDGIMNNADDEITTEQFVVDVTPVNDPPTFTVLGNQAVIFNAGPQTVTGFIQDPSPGPSNEMGQSITYEIIGVSNPDLFSATGQPAISIEGTLTFTSATDVSGSSTITVVARDSGGVANGGQDTSEPQTFVIAVGPSTVLQVANFTQTATGFVIDFNLPIDPTFLNLYDVDPDLVLTRAGATSPLKGSIVLDPSRTRLTYVVTSGVLPAGDYTLTLRSAADGFFGAGEDGTLLDGNSDRIPGDDYVQNFTVEFSNDPVVISIPNFARGPQQPVNIPAMETTGIPVSFSDGGGLLSASFQIHYNPALLTITGATIAPGMPAGTSVALFSFTPGIVDILFTSQEPLPAGITRFIDLQASVPADAPYTSKHVIDITNIMLSDNVPAIDDDAVAVVAYLGDTTANGTYSGLDATHVFRLATGADTGLEQFPLLDPAIIADVTLAGGISATDASAVLQQAAALTVPEIPPLPVPAGQPVMGGPDPKLSIPRDLTAAPGQTVTIPVHLDSVIDLTGTGVQSADLAIYYDPLVLDVTLVTLGDLVLGTGTWMVATRIDPLLGRVFVSLASYQPLEGIFAGELVKLHATVKADAPAGAVPINLAAATPAMGVTTQLNESNLTLIPAPTDAADDPIDGLLTITAAPGNQNGPQVEVVDGQLIVEGTDANDVLIVGRLSPTHVIVRSGNRILGMFDMPEGIYIDAKSGADYINVNPSLPHTIIGVAASDADANIAPDVIIAPPGAEVVDSPLPTPSAPESGGEYIPDHAPQDIALLQLLDQWSAGDDEWEGTPAGRRRR